jgi:hypothetical protein
MAKQQSRWQVRQGAINAAVEHVDELCAKRPQVVAGAIRSMGNSQLAEQLQSYKAQINQAKMREVFVRG